MMLLSFKALFITGIHFSKSTLSLSLVFKVIKRQRTCNIKWMFLYILVFCCHALQLESERKTDQKRPGIGGFKPCTITIKIPVKMSPPLPYSQKGIGHPQVERFMGDNPFLLLSGQTSNFFHMAIGSFSHSGWTHLWRQNLTLDVKF